MGIFDFLKPKKAKKGLRYALSQTGITPSYGQWGDDIFAYDVVQQALRCIVDEVKKLRVMHIVQTGEDPMPACDSLQRILENPNDIMTQSEFLEKITWLLLLNCNAFIIPVYRERKNADGTVIRIYEALYPIKPSQVEIMTDDSGVLYTRFQFANGFECTIPYDDVIHIRTHYAVNDFLGGDESGQPDHRGLLETLRLNSSMLSGVAKAMNASCTVNGIVKYNTMLDDGKIEADLAALEAKLKNSENGFLPLDLKAEFTPITRDVKFVDEDTLKFIDEKILRTWHIPLSILTGDYTKDQYAAFYQAAIEPIAIGMGQAFTKKIFTRREQSVGHRIRLYPKDLVFMTVDQTIEMVRILGDSGAMYQNEIREAFGLPPLPELAGKRMQSLNYVDVDIANKYQMEDTKNG